MLLFTTEETVLFYSLSLFSDNTCVVHKPRDSYSGKWKWDGSRVMVSVIGEWKPAQRSVTEMYVSYLQTLVES